MWFSSCLPKVYTALTGDWAQVGCRVFGRVLVFAPDEMLATCRSTILFSEIVLLEDVTSQNDRSNPRRTFPLMVSMKLATFNFVVERVTNHMIANLQRLTSLTPVWSTAAISVFANAG